MTGTSGTNSLRESPPRMSQSLKPSTELFLPFQYLTMKVYLQWRVSQNTEPNCITNMINHVRDVSCLHQPFKVDVTRGNTGTVLRLWLSRSEAKIGAGAGSSFHMRVFPCLRLPSIH
jgi:hypothetical protein